MLLSKPHRCSTSFLNPNIVGPLWVAEKTFWQPAVLSFNSEPYPLDQSIDFFLVPPVRCICYQFGYQNSCFFLVWCDISKTLMSFATFRTFSGWLAHLEPTFNGVTRVGQGGQQAVELFFEGNRVALRLSKNAHQMQPPIHSWQLALSSPAFMVFKFIMVSSNASWVSATLPPESTQG